MKSSVYYFARNILFLSFLFLAESVLVYPQAPYTWISGPKPVKSNLRSVYFVDSLTGWVGGKNGVIYKTTTGGKNWIMQNSQVNGGIVEIFMLNSRRGWILDTTIRTQPGQWYGTHLRTTTDGGETWTTEEYPYIFFYTIYYLDSMKGWLGGDRGTLLSTNDGGISWNDSKIESSAVSVLAIKKIKFFSPSFGIATGGENEFAVPIRRTTNGGESWSLKLTGSDGMNDFCFIDSLHLIAVGGGIDNFGENIMRSTDGGVNWTMVMTTTLGVIYSVGFRTPSEGFAPFYSNNTYLHTLDSGKTWSEWASPQNIRLNDIIFTDSRHGLMVGDSGTVYTYNNPVQCNVRQSWNIISVPVSVPDPMKDVLFPSALTNAFMFKPEGYVVTDTLSNRVGYWLKFPSAQSIEIAGYPRLSDSIQVASGWNMIGTLSEPVPVSNIITDPINLSLSPFFGYSNSYNVADTLYPGKGYWIKSSAPGLLHLSVPEVPLR